MQRLIGSTIIALLILLSTSAIASDTSTTCLPNSRLREMMRLNEVRKVQERELSTTQERVRILDSVVAERDQYIANTSKQDALYQNTISSFEQSIRKLREENKTYEDSIAVVNSEKAVLKKELKKANFKRGLNKIVYGGAAVAIGIVYVLNLLR